MALQWIFFAWFPDRQVIVDATVNEQERSSFETPPRISAAVILATRDLAGARIILQPQGLETSNPGHPAYIRKMALDLGVGGL